MTCYRATALNRAESGTARYDTLPRYRATTLGRRGTRYVSAVRLGELRPPSNEQPTTSRFCPTDSAVGTYDSTARFSTGRSPTASYRRSVVYEHQ